MSEFITVTPELLAGFLDEAPEYLSMLDEGVLVFESIAGEGGSLALDEPAEQERMNEMFRAAHSLKGLAAAMGFDKIRDLTHLMETLFDQIRMRKRLLDPTAIETLFTVFDNLRELVGELSQEGGEPVTISAAIAALEAILNTSPDAAPQEPDAAPEQSDALTQQDDDSESPPPEITSVEIEEVVEPALSVEPAASDEQPGGVTESQKLLQEDPELAKLFVESTIETLEELNQGLLKLEETPADLDVLNEIFRCAHNVKGACGAAGLHSPHRLTHEMETVLDRLRSQQLSIEDSLMNALFSSVDKLRACVEGVRNDGFCEIVFDDDTTLFAQWMESRDAETNEGDGAFIDGAAGNDDGNDGMLTVTVEFPPDFIESEIQSYLIHNKLKDCGEIVGVDPDLDNLDGDGSIEKICFTIRTTVDADEIKRLVGAFSVKSVVVTGGAAPADAMRETSDAGSDKPEPSDTESATNDEPVPGIAVSQPQPDSIPTPAPTKTADTAKTASPTKTTKPVKTAPPPPKPVSGGQKAAQKTAPSAKPGETIRVDLDRLDQLMNLGGELVINKARFVQVHSQLESVFSSKNLSYLVDDMSDRLVRLNDEVAETQSKSRNHRSPSGLADTALHLAQDFDQIKTLLSRVHESRDSMNVFSEALHSLNLISEGIQKRIMETRMVSVGPLFQRFRRVVRDIAKSTSKRVDLVLHGEATEMDKRMIDELADPITHMVRNSVDHGIELPDERIAAGKPPVASVELNAYHRGRHICIEIRDDGKGVDVERVRELIVERELATAKQVEQMSHKEIIQHVFKPGFSTATEVTDLSGRGMGMDIVLSKIDKINGAVDIESEPGVGTTVTIQLPLTLAIITALLCRIGRGVYAVPLEMVAEILTVRNEEIQYVQKKRVIVVRERVIPLARFDHIFQIKQQGELTADEPDGELMTVIVLAFQNEFLGLVVDDLIGQEDVVIKNLAANFRNVDGIAGASIMGDGSVSLILDVAAMMQMFVTREQQRNEIGPPVIEAIEKTEETVGA